MGDAKNKELATKLQSAIQEAMDLEQNCIERHEPNRVGPE